MRAVSQFCLGFLLLLLALSQPVGRGAAARLQQAASPSPTATLEPTAAPPQARLLVPTGGQALQGSIAILGDLPLEGFISAELSFAYAGDSTATWFLIAPIATPVISGTLAAWDTTTITDGDYRLRLEARYADGRTLTAFVEGLRVRNYSTVETSTPTPVTPTLTPLPGDTPIPTVTATPTETPIPPTPTPLPPNPATLTPERIGEGLWRGALAMVGLFALLGIYQAARLIWLRRR